MLVDPSRFNNGILICIYSLQGAKIHKNGRYARGYYSTATGISDMSGQRFHLTSYLLPNHPESMAS